MEHIRDADGFTLPPTPISTGLGSFREDTAEDSQKSYYAKSVALSDVSGASTGSSRKKVEDPYYQRNNLAKNNMMKRHLSRREAASKRTTRRPFTPTSKRIGPSTHKNGTPIDLSQATGSRTTRSAQVSVSQSQEETNPDTVVQTTWKTSTNRQTEVNVEEFVSDEEAPQDGTLGRPILINLGTRIVAVTWDDILSCFWAGGLDTPCMICNNGFDNRKGPLIRTLALVGDDIIKSICGVDVQSQVPLVHVYNRHLSCAQEEGINFVTISHVWHQAVADSCETRQGNKEAALLVFKMPMNALAGAVDAFGPNTEVWHDYISIPQWQYNTQQRLLLALPSIYQYASNCLVHLDEVSAECFRDTLLASLPDRLEYESSCDRLDQLAEYFRSRWFTRMWTALEYWHSNQLSILTKEFEVIRHSSFPADSFTHLHDFLKNQTLEIVKGFGRFSSDFKYDLESFPIVDLPPRTRVAALGLSLGESLKIVAPRQCRNYRDRFLAICGFINLGDYAEITSQLPNDPVRTCLWVWLKCLERGDYTPLLLAPGDEVEVAGASWLIGHERMCKDMWELGAVISPADCSPTIHNSNIIVEMEPVGELKSVYFINPGNHALMTFIEILVRFRRLYVTESGYDIDTFIAAIGRIYGVPLAFHTQASIHMDLSEYLDSNPELKPTLENLLDQFSSAVDDVNSSRGLEIAKDIVELLHMSEPMRHLPGNFTRLEFLQVQMLGYGNHNAIGVVHCTTCEQLFLFRLGLRDLSWEEGKVYRIPGLTFACSYHHGVCLVIRDKRIIGRMVYGTPACICHEREQVEIE